MRDSNLDLFAHLMRRAGFGATRDELEVMAVRSYESVVEDLVNPERFPEIDEDVAERYFTIRWGTKGPVAIPDGQHSAPPRREGRPLLA